jgi:hypothetical protein
MENPHMLSRESKFVFSAMCILHISSGKSISIPTYGKEPGYVIEVRNS